MTQRGLFDREPYNGRAPFVAGSDTSEAASASIQGLLNTMQARVLSIVRESLERGVTCDEIEAGHDFKHQTASARLRELAQKGCIRDSGRRRLTRSKRKATVWVVPQAKPCSEEPVADLTNGILDGWRKR